MKNIACCGLDCGHCDAYLATIRNDDKLREQTAKKWAEMNSSPQITSDTINCMGCRGNGVKFAYCEYMCEIRKCVISKNYDTCAECLEVDTCGLVGAITNMNADAKCNLEQLKSKAL